jgi:hypothetical protein
LSFYSFLSSKKHDKIAPVLFPSLALARTKETNS